MVSVIASTTSTWHPKSQLIDALQIGRCVAQKGAGPVIGVYTIATVGGTPSGSVYLYP